MIKKISYFILFSLLGYSLLISILAIYKIPFYYLYALFGLVFGCVIFIFRFDSNNITYDNVETFRFPLINKNYYKASIKSLNNVISLVLFSLLLALALVLSLIKIPSFFPILHVSLVFLIFALASLIYGPLYGILFGFLTDILSYLISPPPFPFFFGYTFNKMLSCFIFSLFFFKTKISFFKALLAMFLVNFLVNSLLGTIWWGMVSEYKSYDLFYNHFIAISLPKNLMFFIPQTFLLYFFIYFLRPVLFKFNLINESVYKNFGVI